MCFDVGLLLWGGISSGCSVKNGFLASKQDLRGLDWWAWGGGVNPYEGNACLLACLPH